ncbi:MAG: PAS domain S-box protein [Acidimicrobiales bacterium]
MSLVIHTGQGLQPEQFLVALVASTDDAIAGETLDGVVVSWNAAAERLYGYRAAEMIDHFLLLLHRVRRTPPIGPALRDAPRIEE